MKTNPIQSTEIGLIGWARATMVVVCMGLHSIVGIASTVASATPTGTPEEVVRQRATERWQARLAGDFEKDYAFSTPGYRSITTLEAHKAQIGSAVRWTGAAVEGVKCEPAKCVTKVRIDAVPTFSGKRNALLQVYVDEIWLQEDGGWWIYLKN